MHSCLWILSNKFSENNSLKKGMGTFNGYIERI
jgi:hypothetical protein